MTNLFERLVEKRGFSEQFLNPKYEECLDSFLLPDMDKAVERIKSAVDNKEKVLVYGDYDADGVTATTLMVDALRSAGIKDIEIVLPNRFSDGYGMNKSVVSKASKVGVKLVITVDCGSGNAEVIEELKKKGIDTIVTDHHECPEELKEAVAFVNPKRSKKIDKNFRDLAGVGVAFKLAQALTEKGMIKKGQEKWLLDLVLIGTICDSMKMTEENRRLCYYGMKVLKKTRRVGLRELMKVCKAKRVDSELIGFRIGPRLNASGRMADAEKSLSLLMEENSANSAKIALELNDLNSERRKQQDNAIKDIQSREVFDDRKVIIVKGKWHEGILGIVAGKLMETIKKPVIVLTEKKDELKGSGRSFGEFNLAEALEFCKKEIISGGGHSAACGVRVLPEKLEAFDKKINKFYDSLNLRDQERFLEKKEDLEVNDFSEFSREFVQELNELEPFSEGNEEPVFLLKKAFLVNVRKVGKEGEHLSLRVRDKKGNTIKLVAFYAPEEWMSFSEGEKADIWVSVMENDWEGRKSVEGRILKMRLVEEEIF